MKNAGKRKSQSEVVARARLRGPLNDLFDETELSDGIIESSSMEAHLKDEPMKQRGRPPKKFREANLPETSAISQRSLKNSAQKRGVPASKQAASDSDDSDSDHSLPKKAQSESCVYKLFGRRVDMSKFSKNTPLYPVCRAWFQNNPEDPNAINFRARKQPVPKKRNFDGPELWEKVRRNEITEVNELPRPLDTDLSHIPPPLPATHSQDKATIDLVLRTTNKNKTSVDDLLKEHQARWSKVRQHWQQHTIRYRHERFKYSYLILQHLQRRNKEQMMQQQM